MKRIIVKGKNCHANVFVEVKDQELIHTPAIYIIAEKWNRREGG